MSKHQMYRNPPIEEAICEFQFKPSQDWNLTVPGKFHMNLATEYPGKPQTRRVVNISLRAHSDQAPNLGYDEGSARVQMPTEDKKRMVSIGRDVLSIHMLRPYHDTTRGSEIGWLEFRSRIKNALEAYWKVVHPKGVSKVGMRYINKIVVPEKTARIESYIKCVVPVVTGLPDYPSNFVSRAEYPFDDGVRLVVSQGTTGSPTDNVGFLLDLDVVWEAPEPVSLPDALEKAEMLRDRERQAFETVITDLAREAFDVG